MAEVKIVTSKNAQWQPKLWLGDFTHDVPDGEDEIEATDVLDLPKPQGRYLGHRHVAVRSNITEGDRLARFFATSAVEEHERSERVARVSGQVARWCEHDEFGPFSNREGRVAAMISRLADGSEVVLNSGAYATDDFHALRERFGGEMLSVRYYHGFNGYDAFIVRLYIPRGA